MELKLKIKYKDLLNLVKQLPVGQLVRLKAELKNELTKRKSKSEQFDFQQFLLNGPVMDEPQYQQFLEHRKAFNKWRGN